MYQINNKEYNCSLAVSLDIFNDKWKLYIIWQLLSGEKRFKSLNQNIGEISQKTLCIKLKELEEKNIIYREAFAQVPLKVVYSLSPVGKELKDVLDDMHRWGKHYVKTHGKIT